MSIKELKHVSAGPLGNCAECQDEHGWALSEADFELDSWTERDRVFYGLRDKATQQHHIVELWDDEAREFLDDHGIMGGPQFERKLFAALWADAIARDALDDVPEDVRTAAFNARISSGRYLDEGGISCAGCDCCGCSLQQTLYDAHGIDDAGELVHLQLCEDCVYSVTYGDDEGKE